MFWRTFHLSKRGHADDEYEDASAANPETGRFAIADGASESSFAAPWARLLVEGFCESTTDATLDEEWLEPMRRRWTNDVDALALPWYAEEKREQGAFSTFLGVTLEQTEEGGRWRAVAVGDSCLFHVRGGELLTAFPVSRPEDFGNQPRLLGSRSQSADGLEAPCQAEGTWQPEDRLFLMTDAFAQWFLQRCAQGDKPWQEVENHVTEPEEAFAAWVEELRDGGGLRNDDVTMLFIARGE